MHLCTKQSTIVVYTIQLIFCLDLNLTFVWYIKIRKEKKEKAVYLVKYHQVLSLCQRSNSCP